MYRGELTKASMRSNTLSALIWKENARTFQSCTRTNILIRKYTITSQIEIFRISALRKVLAPQSQIKRMGAKSSTCCFKNHCRGPRLPNKSYIKCRFCAAEYTLHFMLLQNHTVVREACFLVPVNSRSPKWTGGPAQEKKRETARKRSVGRPKLVKNRQFKKKHAIIAPSKRTG